MQLITHVLLRRSVPAPSPPVTTARHLLNNAELIWHLNNLKHPLVLEQHSVTTPTDVVVERTTDDKVEGRPSRGARDRVVRLPQNLLALLPLLRHIAALAARAAARGSTHGQ